jgi:hypothetical protein
LQVTLENTGGTPSYTADAPWNLISRINFKNSAGQNLVAPLSGYEWYIINKYGAQGQGLSNPIGNWADPKVGPGYTATPATGATFFLDVPLEFDAEYALGVIPALASNRSYQLEIEFASIATVFGATTPPTAATVTVDATANYWDVPIGSTPGGNSQATEPFGLGALSLWQKENPNLAPGEQLTRSNNTGNVIRNLIFIAREADGTRTETDWPTVTELYVDNNPMLRFKKLEWRDMIARTYGYSGTAEAAGGPDNGVYVIPFHTLAGGMAGNVQNSRAQLLATLDATLLQVKGYDWGADISQMAIITQAIAADNPAFIFSK